MKALRPTTIPFPSTGSFTRASTATYIEDGILKTAAVNEPRWQNGNLLLEKAQLNKARRSEEFDNAVWSKTNVSVTPNVAIAPDTNTSMDKIIATSVNDRHEIRSNGGAIDSVLSAELHTFSVYVAASELRYFALLYTTGGSVGFDLLTGSVVGVATGGASASITFVGSGIYRCSMTFTPTGAAGAIYICLRNTAGSSVETFLGDNIRGLYLWGAQLEVGSTSSSYIPTAVSTVTRAADSITGTGLIYTNTIDARPMWSDVTTYSIGQVIRYNNTVYESLQNTNLNKQPDTNPTWWLSLGADNISAAFDGKVGSKTTSTDKLRMIIKPGTNIDSVGYIEATASTISTSAIDEDYNLVYSYKSGLDTSIIEDWYDYFFLDPLGDPLTQVVHQGINPLDPNLVIGVEMVRSGTVELGVFVTGQTTAIGKTQYGLRAGIVDYSKKEADEFGNITIVERPYSKRLEGDVYVNNYDLNKVQRFLYNVRATPILWIASDSEELAEVSNVYGFYKDFSTTIAYPDVSMCSLQIEGLV